MISIKPQIIEKNGKKEFAVLSYDEFLKVKEELEALDDLRCLREAKKAERDATTISLRDLKKEFNISQRRTKSNK